MPASCCALDCRSRHTKQSTLRFHRFPFSYPDLLKKWKLAVNRKNWEPKRNSSYLCSLHFEESCYATNLIPAWTGKTYDERKKLVPRKNKKLKKDAVPTKFGSKLLPIKKAGQLLKNQPILPLLSFQELSSANVQSSHEPLSANAEISTSDTDTASETDEIVVELKSIGVQVNRLPSENQIVCAESQFFKIESVSTPEDEQFENERFCDAATSPHCPENTHCSTASQCSLQRSLVLKESFFYNFNSAHCSILKRKINSVNKKILLLKMKMECLLNEYHRLEKLMVIATKNLAVNYEQEEELIPSKKRKLQDVSERTSISSDAENIGRGVTDVNVENHITPQQTEIIDSQLIAWRNDCKEENAHIGDLTVQDASGESGTSSSMKLLLITESEPV